MGRAPDRTALHQTASWETAAAGQELLRPNLTDSLPAGAREVDADLRQIGASRQST